MAQEGSKRAVFQRSTYYYYYYDYYYHLLLLLLGRGRILLSSVPTQRLRQPHSDVLSAAAERLVGIWLVGWLRVASVPSHPLACS